MLAAIKEIINPDVVLDITTGDKRLTLKEQGADSKLKKLHIQDVPADAFAFTLDHQPGKRDNRLFKQLSCYVDVGNDKGVNKGCDLILLVPQNGNQWIVLIFDLKSDKPKIEATKKQLLNSELYVRYLMTMVKHHYDVDTNSVEYKRAIVTTAERSVRKTATYQPNERTPVRDSFHIKAVCVRREEAHVHLGALLK